MRRSRPAARRGAADGTKPMIQNRQSQTPPCLGKVTDLQVGLARVKIRANKL